MKDRYYLYKDRLGSQYRPVFEEIELYVDTQRADTAAKEAHLGLLLDTFLSAQASGKPVTKLVGKNMEAFCKTFCSVFTWKNRIFSLLDRLHEICITLLVLCVLELLIGISELSAGVNVDLLQITSTINISALLLGFLISGLAGTLSDMVVRHLMFKSRRISMRLLKVITWGIAVAVFAVCLCLLFASETDFIRCPVWIMALGCIVFLVPYYIFARKYAGRSKQEHIPFAEFADKELRSAAVSLMESKFNRINTRREKKGLAPMPFSEFLDAEEKLCRIDRRWLSLYYLLPPACTLLALLLIRFDSLFDACLFCGFLLAVTYPVNIWLLRLSKKDVAVRQDWITAKRAELSGDIPHSN